MSIAGDITADVAPGEFFDGDGRQIEDLAGERDPDVIGLGSERVIYRFTDRSALIVTLDGWMVFEKWELA